MKTASIVIAALVSAFIGQAAHAQVVIGPVQTNQVPVDSPWLLLAMATGLFAFAIKFRQRFAKLGGLAIIVSASLMASQIEWVQEVTAASGSNETITSATTQTITLQGSITNILNSSGAALQVKSINFVIGSGAGAQSCTQELGNGLPPNTVNCEVGTVFEDGQTCYLECRPAPLP